MWFYMSQDQQLRVAIEEVVNTFSPALSLDLLLYNVLGSNSDIAMCLVHFLIRSYSTNQAWSAHTKTTLRNMIRWSVLTGFTLCIFLPWAEIRSLTLSLSRKAAVTNLLPLPWCRSAGVQNPMAGMSGASSAEWPTASAHHRLHTRRSRNAKPTSPHWPFSWTCRRIDWWTPCSC
ncbi:hypothetical protein XENOCAPTIV_010283 [Xenoophorus captivus]|uniref:Uncharacterized protein n=1 Tax=Xenoophorus captivus TaxID=1517983 RepID=A0ABV0RZN2_9TELE